MYCHITKQIQGNLETQLALRFRKNEQYFDRIKIPDFIDTNPLNTKIMVLCYM